MNTVSLIGRLTADPDVRVGNETQKAYARFSIAVNRAGKDAGADFPNIVCFGKIAELVGQYVHKGMNIGISGRIQTGKYEKDGRFVYTTDVVADKVEFLDRGTSDEGDTPKKQYAKKEAPVPGFSHADDIPF